MEEPRRDLADINMVDMITAPAGVPSASAEAHGEAPEGTQRRKGDVTPSGGMITLPAAEPPLEPDNDEVGTEQWPGGAPC